MIYYLTALLFLAAATSALACLRVHAGGDVRVRGRGVDLVIDRYLEVSDAAVMVESSFRLQKAVPHAFVQHPSVKRRTPSC
jgi:hypothetical protein